MPPEIEFRDFHHTYLRGTPQSVEALEGVSLAIARGERVALLGATGSGKSTLVAATAHLLPLQRGQVFYQGQDIAAANFDRAALRRSIGILFQETDSQIIEDVVGKDVAFGPTAAGLSAAETRRRVEESLNAVGLPYESYRLRYVYALSGGQRRRVALAGLLAMHTPVMVLDEPLAGLDPLGREELLGVLRAAVEDRARTLIVASASLAGAALLCDRVVVLNSGRVVMEGTLREILSQGDRLAALDIGLPELSVVARALNDAVGGIRTNVLGEDELLGEILRQLRAG
jgi:energy-coupling factor transport system ATP-binding protein